MAALNGKLWKGLVAKKIDFELLIYAGDFLNKCIFNPLITSQTKQNGADKHFTTTAVLHHNGRCLLWCKPTEKRTYLIRCTPLVKKHNVYFPQHFTQAGINNCFCFYCCYNTHTYILYLWAKNWFFFVKLNLKLKKIFFKSNVIIMIVLVPWKNEESSNHCIHSCSSFVGIKVLLLKYNEKFQSLPYHQHLIAFLNNRNNWKLLSRHTHTKNLFK